MMRHPLKHKVTHHAKQVLRQAIALNRPLRWMFGINPMQRFKLDKKTVLILDTADQASNLSIAALVKNAKKQGGVLILSGDSASTSPVEAGGAFALLAKKIGFALLRHVANKVTHEDRELVEKARSGDGKAILNKLAERGRLTVSATRQQATENLISTWTEKERGTRALSLILCGTAAEATDVNKKCQQRRFSVQELEAKPTFAIDENSYYVGDRIIFQKSKRPLNVAANDIGTITSINTVLKRFTAMLDDGRRVVIPFHSYKDFALAYAIPSYIAASTTPIRAYVLLGGEKQDREHTYVQLSRAPHETHVFVNKEEGGRDLEHLAEQMSTSRAKTTALTFKEAAAESPKPQPSEEPKEEQTHSMAR